MVFPVIKLGYLVVKQVSKPLANALKRKAKTSPFLKNYILVPPAQRKYLYIIARSPNNESLHHSF